MTDLENRIAAELAALEGLDLNGLRAAWQSRFRIRPKLRSVELLRLNLAWRIQAEAFGGLDAEMRRRVRRSRTGERGEQALEVGAQLIREWKGVRHEVQVTDAGYLYDGDRYKSLSQIARAITGVRWNGPRFFGLARRTDTAERKSSKVSRVETDR